MPLPKVNKRHDQLLGSTTANFEQRKGVVCFDDKSWTFGIKAFYFFRTFSGKKLVTVSQQECFGLEEIGISPKLIDRPHCVILHKK